MPDKYFDVNGIATLVHHRGVTTLPGAPPNLHDGQPILFLHDAGVNGNTFGEVMDLLMANHSPVSLDLPGHGRSGSLDSLASVGAMASHVESLISPWELQSLVVVGEGLGAAIGTELAANAVLPITALICVGAVGPFVSLTEEISQLTKITTGKARREFDKTGYAHEPEEKLLRKAFGHWVTTDPRATLGAREAQAEWNENVDLENISCRTIVVIGEHTEEALKDSSQSFANHLTSGEVSVIGEAGRRSAQETPEEFCTVILNSISGSPETI